MGLFYNNYQRLYQENVDECAKLSEENGIALRKMWSYINAFDVSLFELEVIKKDLIGIAGEADLEGVNVADKLGIPEKEFCDSLTSGILKKNRFERIMIFVKNRMLVLLALFILSFLSEGMPVKFEISSWYLFYTVLFFGIGEIVYRTTIAKKNFIEQEQLNKRKKTLIVLYCILFVLAIITIFFELPMIIGNGWIMLAVLCLLTAILFFGNNLYWDKCSEKYNWR